MTLLSELEVCKLPSVRCKEPVHTFKTHIIQRAGQCSTLAGLPLQSSYHSIAASRMAAEDGRHADTLQQRLALNKRLLQRPQHLSHSCTLHLRQIAHSNNRYVLTKCHMQKQTESESTKKFWQA